VSRLRYGGSVANGGSGSIHPYSVGTQEIVALDLKMDIGSVSESVQVTERVPGREPQQEHAVTGPWSDTKEVAGRADSHTPRAVELKAGESKTVAVTVPTLHVAIFDTATDD